MEIPSPPFLFTLFYELYCSKDFSIDLRSYNDFLKLFVAGFGRVDDSAGQESAPDLDHLNRDNLLAICKTLWLSRPEQSDFFEKRFNHYFDQFAGHQPVRIEPPTNFKPPEHLNLPHVEPRKYSEDPSAEKDPKAKSGQKKIWIKLSDMLGKKTADLPIVKPAGESFNFSHHTIPIPERKIKQHWRFIKQGSRPTPTRNISIKDTVDSIVKNGNLLIEPAYLTEKRFRGKLLYLSDCGDSMVAFDELSDFLFRSLQEGLKESHIERYFFRNVPHSYIYQKKNLSDRIKPQAIFTNVDLLLLFSDAGAARVGRDDAREERTRKFLKDAFRWIDNIIWLNPIPKVRWSGTSAEFIAGDINMVEVSFKGLTELPGLLKQVIS